MVEVLPPDFAAECLAWTHPDTTATRIPVHQAQGARTPVLARLSSYL